ncbi:hypothetical protein VTO73DRAFT_10549 [Trametes versicolor]
MTNLSDPQPPQRNVLADPNPGPTDNRCQVIPADGEPPCTRRGKAPWVQKDERPRADRGENRILCPEHDNERQRFYFRYKAAAAETDRQDMDIAKNAIFQVPLQVLSAEQVGEAIAMRKTFASLIDDEFAARESHRRRFVAQVDFGHSKWLRGRHRKRDANRDALNKLRRHRDSIGATPGGARNAPRTTQFPGIIKTCVTVAVLLAASVVVVLLKRTGDLWLGPEDEDEDD